MSAVITEAWNPVIGYEGIYEVSTRGRVRSLHSRHATPRILKPYVTSDKDPHLKVTLCLGDGSRKNHHVHRLVFEAFHGPVPEGQEVRHLDGDAQNNRPENLAAGTHSRNTLDSVAHGTHYFATRTHCPQNHPYDEHNTRWYDGKRSCRACRAERDRKRYRRRKGVAA